MAGGDEFERGRRVHDTETAIALVELRREMKAMRAEMDLVRDMLVAVLHGPDAVSHDHVRVRKNPRPAD